jgi:hypothetical protein
MAEEARRLEPETLDLLAIAVGAFLVVACLTLQSLWSRRFRVVITPYKLWHDYWSDSAESIKHAVVADLADGYVENNRLLHGKRRSLAGALVGVGIEAVAIGVALAVSSL